MGIFKSDTKLSTREQALVSYAVFSSLKNEEGLRRVRDLATDVGLTVGLLEQVDAAVQAARSADQQDMSLDEALAKAAGSSCCQG